MSQRFTFGHRGGSSDATSRLATVVTTTCASESLTSVTMYGNASGRDTGGLALGRGAGIWSNNNDPTGTVSFDVRDSLIAGNMANGALGNCRLVNTGVSALGYNIANIGRNTANTKRLLAATAAFHVEP